VDVVELDGPELPGLLGVVEDELDVARRVLGLDPAEVGADDAGFRVCSCCYGASG